MTTQSKTVAIIGAGPVGLAAAAHALERGLEPIVLEAGPEAGHAVRQWSHVRMFSPWEYNVDKAAERLLIATGWNAPDPKSLSDRRRLRGALYRAACYAHATQGSHQDIVARHGDQPGRLRQGQDQGTRSSTVRDPLSERERSGEIDCRRGHRCVRHVVRTQSCRSQWPASAGRA